MNIDHVHFYVEDAEAWRDWFTQILGFQAIASGFTRNEWIEVVGSGTIRIALTSPCTPHSSVARYLSVHPAGVADLAFQVDDLDATITAIAQRGGRIFQPIQTEQQLEGRLRWAQIASWGKLVHTLIERSGATSLLPQTRLFSEQSTHPITWKHHSPVAMVSPFTALDHIVLNVAAGDLDKAVTWYEDVMGFERQQTFAIRTERSGLCSQVLVHPQGNIKLPINEPASMSSQIQEFLDLNRGPGIQHIALRTQNIVDTMKQLRQRGLAFLHVPQTYYSQLRARHGFQLSETLWQAIAQQEVLVDWQPDLPQALLLQAFTQPIFKQPTFFLELIERQVYRFNDQVIQAQGFGEGNFRALFEAIEREQLKRGRLI